MRHPRLYLDEDVAGAVAAGLRRRGYDVVTTLEAGRAGSTDEEQLHFAVSGRRTLFSFNRGDFANLHAEMVGRGMHHFGIVLSKQVPVGVTVGRLSEWLARTNADDVRDQLVWLGV
jgi:hypothetical protein